MFSESCEQITALATHYRGDVFINKFVQLVQVNDEIWKKQPTRISREERKAKPRSTGLIVYAERNHPVNEMLRYSQRWTQDESLPASLQNSVSMLHSSDGAHIMQQQIIKSIYSLLREE